MVRFFTKNLFWIWVIVFQYPVIFLYAGTEDIIENADSIKAYLMMDNFSMDNNAEAIILYEKGNTFLQDNVLSYKVERTIKILSQNAVNQVGTVAVPTGSRTNIKKVSGITYNIENGETVIQKIDKADILKDKITRNISALKFNLPSLKAGSILHYSFTLEYFTFIGVPNWNFQHEYPVVFSEYQTSIPDYYIYTDLSRTSIPFIHVDKEKELNGQAAAVHVFTAKGPGNYNMLTTTWVRKNIPALRKEPFRLGDENYLERVKLHFTGIAPYKGSVIPLFKSWEQVTEQVLKDGDIFPQAYAGNGFLKDKVTALAPAKSSELEKATSIFSYVRNNFVLESNNDEHKVNLHHTFDTHTGNLQELNLLLTSMLRKAGLNSEPVILSTKPHEPLNSFFPNIQDANYIISKVRIDDKDYYLDASQKYLPFGILLPECYNGYCRIINEKGYSMNINPSHLADKNIILASLNVDQEKEKKLRLVMDVKYGNMTALGYRQIWKGDEQKAKKELRSLFNLGSFQLTSISVKNVSDPDKSLLIHYEAETELGDKNIIYLTAFFDPFFHQNPFTAVNRTFPVNLEYEYDYNYTLNFQVPDAYKIDEYPKQRILKFDSDLMYFQNLVDINENKNKFSLNSKFETHTTIFPVEEYTGLRSFFEQMIASQNERIVLIKSN